MHILYLSQYFPPEVGATQTRAYEMARGLVQAGHRVTMIAEVPNHPSGIVPPAYRGKWVERSALDGIDVLRVWVKASPVKTFTSRMAFYLSYMANAALVGALQARGPFDVVYATSPPLFVGAAGLALHGLKRAPFVFEVRDLWPESAVALGELSSPRAIAWAGKLEELCYNRASRIVVVTEGIRQRLLSRGFPAGKLALIPNGANTELFQPQPELGQRFRAEHGLAPNAFVAAYAGIHGIAQGLETLLDAAAALRNDPGICFVLVGEGPVKAELQALRAELALDNVLMLPEQPRAAMPAILSAADAAIVPLRKLELFQGALPSKMFDAWACALPLLLSIDGEARRTLEAAQGGLYVPPEDAAALAEAIHTLAAQPDRGRSLGQNGRRYTEEHHSRQAQARQLEQLLQETSRQGNK
ncbi:MAG TPA: glycosyltransferase family 4 protein [Anaerolineae bacterium]|nr:glycosyltransferase family 4 protein [Anaerolineae bacterium]